MPGSPVSFTIYWSLLKFLNKYFLSWVKCAVISTAIKMFRRKTSKMEMRETLYFKFRWPVTELWRGCETLLLWVCYLQMLTSAFQNHFSRLPHNKSLIIKMFFIDYLLIQDFRMLWLSLQKEKPFFHSSDSTYYCLNFYLVITHAD